MITNEEFDKLGKAVTASMGILRSKDDVHSELLLAILSELRTIRKGNEKQEKRAEQSVAGFFGSLGDEP